MLKKLGTFLLLVLWIEFLFSFWSILGFLAYHSLFGAVIYVQPLGSRDSAALLDPMCSRDLEFGDHTSEG